MTDTLLEQTIQWLALLERRVDDLVEPEVISDAAGGTGVTPQVTYWTGTKTIGGDPGLTYDAANDALSMLSAISTEPILELQNTNVDALSGSIQFYKNSATPADGDDLGTIEFHGETSTGAKERYAYMLTESDDVTNGDTAGRFRLIMTMDAVERNMLDVDMYNGVVNQGTITFNAEGQDVDYYVESVGHADALFIRGSDGQITFGAYGPGYIYADAVGVLSTVVAPVPAPHDILSVSHSDSVANAVTQGSLIYGNATPAWDELNHPGAANRVLQSSAADVQWSAQTLTLTTSLTNQGANGVLAWGGAFTLTIPATGTAVLGTGAANTLSYWSGINTQTNLANAAGYLNNNGAGALSWVAAPAPAAHAILSASHNDTTVAAVVRGDVMTGQGVVPTWARLAVGGAATFLRSDGVDPSWAAIIAGDLPAHTHSGAGQGGSLVIGTTDTDATAGSVLFAGVAGVIQEDNANFFWDDATNHLGIGDASPDAPLDVYNATVDIVGFFESGDDIGGIKVADNDTTGYVYAADAYVFIGGDAAKAATNMVINATTGYVGIGDVTPDASLDVYHATTDIVGFFESGDDIAGIKFEDDDTVGYAYVADGNIYIGGDAAKAVTNLHVDVTTGHTSIGIAPNADRQLQVYDAGITTTNTYYGIYNYHTKTGGATGAGDDFYGSYNYVLYNDGTNIIDDLRSGYFETEIDNGTVSLVIGTQALVNADGGAPGSIYAGMFRVDQDGSAVVGNVYGVYTVIDLDSGSIGNDVFGHYIWVDDDIGASTVHMLYLSEQSGVDYGIYQDGSAENRFGGIVNGNPSGVRTITSIANISDPPTDAELDAIFGTPAAVGDGFLGLIDDSGAGTHGVSVVALNGAWWYGNLNKAV